MGNLLKRPRFLNLRIIEEDVTLSNIDLNLTEVNEHLGSSYQFLYNIQVR